jgi:hypothetical protein
MLVAGLGLNSLAIRSYLYPKSDNTFGNKVG